MPPWTPDDVWNAYRALHRYVIEHPPTYGMKVPASLPHVLTGDRNKAAAERLAAEITEAWDSHPVAVSPEYFGYLYLFVQLLRCNYEKHPDWTAASGWSPLRWMYFSGLAGKANARAFAQWYYTEWMTRHPRPSEGDLQVRYPLYLSVADESLIPLPRAAEVLQRLMREQQVDAGAIFRQFNGLGSPRSKSGSPRHEWPAWLVMARPETWAHSTEGVAIALVSPLVVQRVYELLREPEQFRAFVHQAIPVANPDNERAALQAVCDGIDLLTERGKTSQTASRATTGLDAVAHDAEEVRRSTAEAEAGGSR
jgi:hypothetical protein